jgi:hypothetical protein
MADIKFLIVLRRYVPVLATGIPLLPFCFIVIQSFLAVYTVSFTKLLSACLILGVVIIINVIALHKGMEIFSKWQEEYLR